MITAVVWLITNVVDHEMCSSVATAGQARPVRVTGALRRILTRRARGRRTPYRDTVGALMGLLAAQRWSHAAIAVQVGVSVDTVRTWRGRFADQGLAGLRSAAPVQPGADRSGQGTGLPATPGHGSTVGAVVVSGTGP